MPFSATPERAAAAALRLARVGVDRRERGRPAGAILDDIDLVLAAGETVAVTGPSGAGKTTLLHAVAALLRPDRGTVSWGDTDVSAWPERQRDRWRRDTVGLVFQDFALVPELGVIENILLPLRFDGFRLPAEARRRAEALAARVGIEMLAPRTAALSRGEQQRVAVARALIRRPALLLADEPTASLDAATGARVADLLLDAARETGASLLIVSHDPALLARADRVHRLVAGRLVAEPLVAEAAP
ncbi:MAG: ATP-binding cassette domain-containing protein [Rhodoplanes sp.]|uniref:ABC transporter ATP-binding protein n=1 Tax=Rhodoplanes sp. TaxID=1968906 RepID=UPI0017953D06|nr:ATP-binding cassette domain-containing protein [Rhodoplanes sp.]NVO14770.1 ATP-binding cassette domain-containing protein [Rhodoplanes sp.]